MFDFVSTSKVSSDGTCNYDIKLDRQYTVREFIKEVLSSRSKEWGDVSINNEDKYAEKQFCDYRRGSLISKTITEENLEKKVKSVKAYGGWTRMDYTITCE